MLGYQLSTYVFGNCGSVISRTGREPFSNDHFPPCCPNLYHGPSHHQTICSVLSLQDSMGKVHLQWWWACIPGNQWSISLSFLTDWWAQKFSTEMCSPVVSKQLSLTLLPSPPTSFIIEKKLLLSRISYAPDGDRLSIWFCIVYP